MGRSAGLRRRAGGAPTSLKRRAERSKSSAGFSPMTLSSQSSRWALKACRSLSAIPSSGLARPPARAAQKERRERTRSSNADGSKRSTATR